jgi:hypothetical protein
MQRLLSVKGDKRSKNQKRLERRVRQRVDLSSRAASTTDPISLQKICSDIINRATSKACEEEETKWSEFVDGSGAPGTSRPVLKAPNVQMFRSNPVVAAISQSENFSSFVDELKTIVGKPSQKQVQRLEQAAKRVTKQARGNLYQLFNLDSRAHDHDAADLHSDLMKKVAESLEVEDVDYVCKGLATGFAIGVSSPVPPSNGLFTPKRDDKKFVPQTDVFENYKSVSLSGNVVERLLKEELRKGWLETVDENCDRDLQRVKLAVIEKRGPEDVLQPWVDDNEAPTKLLNKRYRLIEDYTQNGLNSRVQLNETISLPNYKSLTHLLSQVSDKKLVMCEADISSAFRNIPVKEADKKFLVLKINDLLLKHARLPFGLKSSPYIFSRVYALTFKCVKKILDLISSCGLVYVDDTLLFILEELVDEAFAVCLILQMTLGWKLSLDKLVLAKGPKAIATFAGFQIRKECDGYRVSVPPEKIEKIQGDIDAVLLENKLERKVMQTISGKLSFITAVCPPLKSYLAPFFSVEAIFCSKNKTRSCPLRSLAMSEEVKRTLLLWKDILAQAGQGCLKLEMKIPSKKNYTKVENCLVSDASTTMIAAALIYRAPAGGFNLKWARLHVKDIFTEDPSLKQFERDCSNMVTLELLAVALGCFIAERSTEKVGTIFTDSLAGANILRKGYSHALTTGKVARAICRKWPTIPAVWHIKGEENTLADKLSRDEDYIPSRGSAAQIKLSAEEFLTWMDINM